MQSCVNLSKKSTKNCELCYTYLLENCPEITKKDTVTKTVEITLVGENLTDTLYLISICDSLKKGLIIEKTLIEKKKGNLKMKATIDKKGNLAIDCVSDTIVRQINVAIPCNCVFTSKDLKNYIKVKSNIFWHNSKWWLLGILLIIIFIIWLIKKK